MQTIVESKLPPLQTANRSFDDFFATRGVRAGICKNPRLQPDHFSFDRAAAEQFLRAHPEQDPIFRNTYSTFIEIFEAIRARLASLNLSSSDRSEIAKAAVLSCLYEGYSVFEGKRADYLLDLGRPITSTDVSNVRLHPREDGNQYTADEILEATFATLKSILDCCEYLKTVPDGGASSFDLKLLFRLFNLYVIYKSDWDGCLWLNNNINVEEKSMWEAPALVARAIGLSRDFSLEFQNVVAGGGLSGQVARHRFLSGQLRPTRKINRDFEKFRLTMLGCIHYPFLEWIVNREMLKQSNVARIIDLYLLIVFISVGNLKRLAVPHPQESFAFPRAEFEDFVCKQLSSSAESLAHVDVADIPPGTARGYLFYATMRHRGSLCSALSNVRLRQFC
jgi:hypothetical protein